jgi:hypothetical protein
VWVSWLENDRRKRERLENLELKIAANAEATWE